MSLNSDRGAARLNIASLKTICLPTCSIQRYADHVETIFHDRSVSTFWPPIWDEEFGKCAALFAYADPLQYGIEHDIAHSLLAHQLYKTHSQVVWADAHGRRDLPDKVYEDEEHLVNRVLLYLNTGRVDADYGVLAWKFGSHLPEVAIWLWKMLRL